MSRSRFDPETLDFKSCVPRCEEKDLHPDLVSMLKSMQSLIGWPLLITSGFRPKTWEFSRGRDGSSSHTKKLAVDVSASDSHARYKIVVAAGAVGVPRIGIGKNFVHLDIDETKVHPIMWHYYE